MRNDGEMADRKTGQAGQEQNNFDPSAERVELFLRSDKFFHGRIASSSNTREQFVDRKRSRSQRIDRDTICVGMRAAARVGFCRARGGLACLVSW